MLARPDGEARPGQADSARQPYGTFGTFDSDQSRINYGFSNGGGFLWETV